MRKGTLEAGLRIGKYQIVHLLATGGMSEVYEAIHLGLHKRVALKLLQPELAENVEARLRFLAEGRNAAHLRHTNVVDVSDQGSVGELPFLVMELLEGEDLAVVYARQKPMAAAELIDLLLPVACAIAMGHAKGVIHRDLKPDNIFMHREGRRLIPKVLDFGISRATRAGSITIDAHVFGTPHYMSPEQARGAATDERTDQYSLGVILYEGLTGRLPHDSDNTLRLLHAVANEAFEPPSAYVDLPVGLEQVILRALAPLPIDRFASMHDFVSALIPFASEGVREHWQLELAAIGVETELRVLDAPLLAALRGSQAPTPALELRRPMLTPRRKLQVLAAAAVIAALSCGLGARKLFLEPRPFTAHVANSSARIEAVTSVNASLASELREASRTQVVDAPVEARLTTSAHRAPPFESTLAPSTSRTKPAKRAKRSTPQSNLEPDATAVLVQQPRVAPSSLAPRVELLPAPANDHDISSQPRVRILSAREPRVRLVD